MRRRVLKELVLFDWRRTIGSKALLLSSLAATSLFLGTAVGLREYAKPVLKGLFAEDAGAETALLLAAWKLTEDPFLHNYPLVAILCALAAFITPAYALLASGDQLTKDIQSGHARFLLARASRSELLFGRFLGLLSRWALMGGVAPFLAASLLTYAETGIQPGQLRVGWVTFLYGVPFLAYGAWLNTWASSPGRALLAGFGIWYGASIVSAMSGVLGDWALVFDYVVPSWLGLDLYFATGSGFLLHTGILMGYTGAFLGIAWWQFQRRDIR